MVPIQPRPQMAHVGVRCSRVGYGKEVLSCQRAQGHAEKQERHTSTRDESAGPRPPTNTSNTTSCTCRRRLCKARQPQGRQQGATVVQNLLQSVLTHTANACTTECTEVVIPHRDKDMQQRFENFPAIFTANFADTHHVSTSVEHTVHWRLLGVLSTYCQAQLPRQRPKRCTESQRSDRWWTQMPIDVIKLLFLGCGVYGCTQESLPRRGNEGIQQRC